MRLDKAMTINDVMILTAKLQLKLAKLLEILMEEGDSS